MPPGFVYPVGASEPAQIWVPYAFADEDRIRGNSFGYNLQVIGRLRDGVSLERAQARMDQITAGLAAETPRWFTDRVAKVEPLHSYVTRGVRTWMLMLLGAVAFVMLIACVNLANLMLVRATARSRELGIRSALGASRWDLARALLTESLLLSVAGATLGIGVAWLGVDILRAAMPADVPRVAAIAVDLRILALTGLVAIATGSDLWHGSSAAILARHRQRRAQSTGAGRHGGCRRAAAPFAARGVSSGARGHPAGGIWTVSRELCESHERRPWRQPSRCADRAHPSPRRPEGIRRRRDVARDRSSAQSSAASHHTRTRSDDSRC